MSRPITGPSAARPLLFVLTLFLGLLAGPASAITVDFGQAREEAGPGGAVYDFGNLQLTVRHLSAAPTPATARGPRKVRAFALGAEDLLLEFSAPVRLTSMAFSAFTPPGMAELTRSLSIEDPTGATTQQISFPNYGLSTGVLALPWLSDASHGTSRLILSRPEGEDARRGLRLTGLTFEGPSASPQPVPLPDTVLFLASALTGLVILGRRRRHRA